MPAIAGARALERRRHTDLAACRDEGSCIARPTLVVEIDGQEAARIIEEQRIDTGDEIATAPVRPNAVLAAQVALDHLVRDGDEGLVRAVAALDLRLAAYAAHPFVGACRSIARTTRLRVLPSGREDIGATAEQAAEQGNFLRGRGAVGDRRVRGRRCHRRKCGPLKLAKARLKTLPLGLESGKLLTNGTNLGLGATGCHCSTCSAPCHEYTHWRGQ